MHMACHLIPREMPSMTDQASNPTVEASGVAKKNILIKAREAFWEERYAWKKSICKEFILRH